MVELLAPAGSPEQVRVAVEAGADAVYLGGKAFNARSFAHNFSRDEIQQAVHWAHLFGVRIYVTVNIIVADTELAAVEEYIKFLDQVGADGIIVQDLAVAAIARKIAPALPLHGSTQMTVSDSYGVQQLANAGFSQVVLARELTLQEIKRICRQAPIAVEVFVHGASCMSYSGQCLMSSFIGGRSGNRGACAQPCRLPYQLVRGTQAVLPQPAYILSLKDLNALAEIKELAAAGVSSFKIEGRMKDSRYVQAAVTAYRQALTACRASSAIAADLLQQAHCKVHEGFHRAEQADFLRGRVGRQTVTEKPGHNQGERIGTVSKVRGKDLFIQATAAVQAGDCVGIMQGGNFSFLTTVRACIPLKQQGRYKLQVGKEGAVPGSLYRMQSKKEPCTARRTRTIPIYMYLETGKNGQLVLRVWDENGHVVTAASTYIPVAATTCPTDRDRVIKQMRRLGDTPFSLAAVTMWDERYMIPVSVLNQLRRQGIQALQKEIIHSYRRPASRHGDCSVAETYERKLPVEQGGTLPALYVRCDTPETAAAAVQAGADTIIFGGERYGVTPWTRAEWEQVTAMTTARQIPLWAAMPRVLREKDKPQLQREWEMIVQFPVQGVYIGALGEFAWVKETAPTMPLRADWSLNIFNTTAARVYAGWRCQSVTVSPECTIKQIRCMIQQGAPPLEVLVQGRIEMMITEFSPVEAFGMKSQREGSGPRYIKDRKQQQFPLVTDPYGRTHILNTRELSMLPYIDLLKDCGIAAIRIDARGESPRRVQELCRQYKRALEGTTSAVAKEDIRVTRGHFFHGIG